MQIAAILTSPENHARLDEIRENAQRLNDPRHNLFLRSPRLSKTSPPFFTWEDPYTGLNYQEPKVF
jgi:hypothetical protein